MLPPGYNMYYDLKSNRCIKQQYWDISYNNDHEIDEKNFCEELYNTLQSSINKMLVSDVPYWRNNIWGMDSSAIVSLISKNIQQFKTFNGYFEHENLSEHEKKF